MSWSPKSRIRNPKCEQQAGKGKSREITGEKYKIEDKPEATENKARTQTKQQRVRRKHGLKYTQRVTNGVQVYTENGWEQHKDRKLEVEHDTQG